MSEEDNKVSSRADSAELLRSNLLEAIIQQLQYQCDFFDDFTGHRDILPDNIETALTDLKMLSQHLKKYKADNYQRAKAQVNKISTQLNIVNEHLTKSTPRRDKCFPIYFDISMNFGVLIEILQQ